MSAGAAVPGAYVAYRSAKAGLAGLAIMVASAVPLPAHAESADGEEGGEKSLSTVLFGSMEAGPTKSFAAVGLKRAIGGGLADSGFRLFVKAGISREQTRRQTPRGITLKAEAQGLLGYEWRIGSNFVGLYAGYDSESWQYLEAFALSPIANRYGVRIQADLWSTPTERVMLQANGYASSINGRLWGRLATGWRMPPGFYVGPELEAYRERDYSKLRLGLHVTDLRLLGLSWRLAGGWQRTSDRPAEAYATLGLHWLH